MKEAQNEIMPIEKISWDVIQILKIRGQVHYRSCGLKTDNSCKGKAENLRLLLFDRSYLKSAMEIFYSTSTKALTTMNTALII